MIYIAECNPLTQGFIGLYIVILFFVCIIMMVNAANRDRNVGGIIGMAMLGLILYSMFQCVCDICSGTISYTLRCLVDVFGMLPAAYVLIFLIGVTVLEMMLFRFNRNWKNKQLTPSSIKEAVDNLPVGICCYESNGHILLKNNTIEQICRAYTGGALLNAASFRERVSSGDVQMENGAIIKLKNGEVFSISDTVFATGDDLRVLTAYDITEPYKYTQTLAEQQETVKTLNKELVEYSRQLVEAITAKEVLNAKVKLHDEIGSNLLSSKHFILNGGTQEEQAEIENALRRNLQYLKCEAMQTVRDEYGVICETAEKLDIRLNIQGELTEEEPQRHIIVTGIHECLTNTIRHAGGDELTVVLSETEDRLKVMFTNNGKAPETDIEEHGGLRLLRDLTEENGGVMQICSKPVFMLTLILPKEETKHAI